jgi:hypothetical protein
MDSEIVFNKKVSEEEDIKVVGGFVILGRIVNCGV